MSDTGPGAPPVAARRLHDARHAESGGGAGADPARLRAALATLEVTVAAVSCAPDAVALPSYADGPRPTSTLRLEGAGQVGRGEHVGWSADDHARFAAAARAAVPRGRTRLGDWPAALASLPGYDRAAVEAAGIDLALRQHATTLHALGGVAPRAVRYVVSFGRLPDPVGEAHAHGEAELKIDVDPGWDARTLRALADLARVVVLDWKGTGDRASVLAAHGALPGALLEDVPAAAAPWPPAVAARLSVDAPLRRADDLDGLAVAPVAANLKPARLGGVLELLETASRCRVRGIGIYLGGMFEVGVGRRQLHALAAVLCPDAPNDVAPIARADEVPWRPPRLEVPGAPGFGA